MFERVAGELRATLGVDSAAMCARAGDEACGAKARSGRVSRHSTEPPISDKRRRCEGRRRGLDGRGDDAPRHTPARKSSPVWRAPEGPEGTGGLRDRPLRAKLACGDLAGGRARRRPEHQRCHTATTRGMDGERAGRPRGGRRSVGGTSDNSRIYSPARRSTSCMMRPHTALTHATAATPRTRERQGRICRKSSKP